MILWSDTTVQTLIPQHLSHQVLLTSHRTINTREGFKNATAEQKEKSKAYLGDPWRQSIRYRLRTKNYWQAGFCLDKEAGEPWRKEFPAFDTMHGFLSFQGTYGKAPWLKQAVVGHYRLRMGCGLLINQGFSLGKMFMTQQFDQRNNTIMPYASRSESDYMQGAALQIKWGDHLTLLPYCSVRQLDGTLNQHTLTSIKTDGMHRTQSEEEKRNALWQSVFGARLGWQGEWYEVGANVITTQFQYNYIRNQAYYNRNYFRGHQLTQYSTDYQLRTHGLIFKGEVAIDDKAGFATLNMLKLKLGRYWNGNLIHRLYSQEYHQLHASSLSESSAMQGEQGITLTTEGSLSQQWNMVFMADWFRFSQPQFGIHEDSSQGFESITRATYQHNRSTSFSLGYRIKRKGDYIRHSLDSYLNCNPVPHLSLRTQLKGRIYSEKAQPQGGPSYGYGISQAATWDGLLIATTYPFSISVQADYFDTDDYNTRLYLTEKTILYGFGLPMLYGQGLRYSFVGNLHWGKRVILEAKWAITNYANRTSISSGLQEIKGNTQQDVWVQLRIKI